MTYRSPIVPLPQPQPARPSQSAVDLFHAVKRAIVARAVVMH